MNELEELRSRLTAARKTHLNVSLEARAMLDDLDRAIAIAEQKAARVEELRGNRLDEVETALGRSVELVDRLARERDKAIAAALALREAASHHALRCDAAISFTKVLADTAWLEEHR